MLGERIYFIIEGLDDIEKLMIQHDTAAILKKAILNLRRELSQVHDYLTWFDERDDQPSTSDQRFFMEISSTADAADDILSDLIHNVHSTDLVSEIRNLVNRIRNSFQVPSQTSYTFNTGSNINYGDRQEIGSTNLFLGPNTALAVKKDIRPKSYGHVVNRDIVGFKDEIKTLLSHLLGNDKTQALGIVGMGGSGKTTLAKHVYHHPDIKCHFARKVWVCISQSWNKRDILCDMLRQAKGLPMNDSKQMSDVEIFEDLSKHLSSLLYLVVLDDIWDMNAWYDVSPALPPSKGSKVIVTTRKTGIPKSIDLAVLILKPAPLNATESYELFHRITFLNENPSHMLVKLGVEMVKKCKGLPLSITALAGTLRMDKSERRWRRINETLMQRILNTADSSQGVVKEILEMSYCDLPHYLKPCVLYLSIFPEDYPIKAEQLIQMWIAECLIRCPREDEEYKESIAEEYLEEIIQRCIVQDVQVNYTGQVMSFRIHDLFRELCVDVAKKKGFLKDSHRISSTSAGVLEPGKSSHVRSLICLYRSNARFPGTNLHKLCQNFMPLRVLIICFKSSAKKSVIHEEIGKLIHLRYLELEGWCDIKLPGTIQNLQNLWTLNLKGIFGCTFIPNMFWKMEDLRHLYFPRYYSVEGERCGALNLDRPQKLKTLWNAKEIPRLSPALEKLHIREIKSEEQMKAVLCTPSILSNNLRTFHLKWFDSGKMTILDDMNNLCKCESLTELCLEGEIRSRSLAFPPNLVKLELCLTNLKEIDVMGIIDNCCPQLKILHLGSGTFKGDKLVCNVNSFKELEKLSLFGNDQLKEWTIEKGAMSNLKLLVLQLCHNLQLSPQTWEFVSNVPRLKYYKWRCGKDSQFEINLKLRNIVLDIDSEIPVMW